MSQGRGLWSGGWQAVVAVFSLVSLFGHSAIAEVISLQKMQKPMFGPSVVEKLEKKRSHQVLSVSFDLKELQMDDTKLSGMEFKKVKVDDLPLTSEEGAPSLPFYAVTLPASLGDLEVETTLGEAVEVPNLRVVPSEPEKCRCEDDKNRAEFSFSKDLYTSPEAQVIFDELGDFRGQSVSRILFFPHRYNVNTGKLVVYPKAQFRVKVKTMNSLDLEKMMIEGDSARSAYDYLIVTPAKYVDTLAPWVAWKEQSRGFRFKVVTTEETGKALNSITAKIHSEYSEAQYRYALIIGSEKEVPNYRVYTSGSGKTPTDLPYFAMGGSADFVPDVFAGRVIVENPEDLSRVLGKWMDYEQNAYQSTNGWSRGIGIASNEGSNPSDNDYVTSIQNRLSEAFGTEFKHFYQNDADSTPKYFNESMQKGAMWLTYMGHGSGTSWSSFGQTYSTKHIKEMDNSAEVKPIWIDVACLNGALHPGYAGERLMSEADLNGLSIGTTAFYGGSVNISWHPPAILARGIAFKMADSALNLNGRVLGPVIQAGHLYLSENYSNLSQVRYNQQWYHLQGDPSMQVRVQ